MEITISNFKSLVDVSFSPGTVNVFIGSNGSGKSAILEALGVLSSAISERVDDSILYGKGVRLGTPSLYKSSFKDLERLPLTIEFEVNWTNNNDNWQYKVNLSNPIDNPKPSWEYHSEILKRNTRKIFGRSRATKYVLENFPEIEIDAYKGLLSFLQGIKSRNDIGYARDLYDLFKDYAIYTPNTTTLRGIQSDPFQREPVGLLGGRLSEAVEELLNFNEDVFGTIDLDDLLDLLNWVGSLHVGKTSKDIISPNVPVTSKIIRFTDRFMKEKRNELSAYDASEGSLYVLFLLALVMHRESPRMFAIDNFDQALNPRLARKVTTVFCEQAILHNRVCFLTTHNPLVLDGLDLKNDRIRLFSVDRNSKGHTQVNRVLLTDELLQKGKEGHSLSRLWIMGWLGGVPNI
ncbi:AAA family ATPase [Brevibacillus sp. SYSU BS000544]|uniref:AAA family ATPase n=1 Tax=Brevibacillus sp. SYSU BS000544 TaxID=3416443 RepID=UPI003CE475A9